jgi:hypothetical protein
MRIIFPRPPNLTQAQGIPHFPIFQHLETQGEYSAGTKTGTERTIKRPAKIDAMKSMQ